MQFIEDAFRPYWAYGINNICINQAQNLNDWVKSGNEYQIYNQVKSDKFDLSVFERKSFLEPVSIDCNRFSTAALESVIKIDDIHILPKSLAWILIKQYYSAFYSAHLILRLLGTSLTQLDANTINSVKKVASMYSVLNGVNIENGYYSIEYSQNTNQLSFKKVKVNQDGGSHITLWKTFGERIKSISLNILSDSTSSGTQDLSRKLDELIINLSYVGSRNYSWLTRIRNDLNYKHIHGVWHPYSLDKAQSDQIIRNLNLWDSDVLQIELSNLIGKELVRFSNTCQFIIGLANQICLDMSKRCSVGKSYLNSGFLRLKNIA